MYEGVHSGLAHYSRVPYAVRSRHLRPALEERR